MPQQGYVNSHVPVSNCHRFIKSELEKHLGVLDGLYKDLDENGRNALICEWSRAAFVVKAEIDLLIAKAKAYRDQAALDR